MKSKRFIGFAALALLVLPSMAAHAAVRVVEGAKGDGVADDTAAIQRALDDAAGTHDTVTLKPGTYRIGSLFVKSGSHFDVPTGVTLRGIQALSAYPMRPTRVAGIEMTWPSALINVYGQHDVQITGAGTIDGDGSYWWKSYWDLRKVEEPKGLRWASDYDAKRPRLIQIFKSSDVTLDGPTLTRSGFWTVHICYSHDVTVRHVSIRNNEGGKGPSTDGIDIDSSRKVLVEHADIDVNDDALCLKAGRDADGLRVNRPTEDVVLRDSLIRRGAAVVTFGSETSGGFRNIEAYNLTGQGTSTGVLIKSAKTRGGWGDNLRIHDIHLTNVPVAVRVNMNWNPAYSYATMPAGMTDAPPYYKTLTTPVEPAARGLAHFRNVRIWNLDAKNAKTAFEISAYPDATLNDFAIDHVNVAAQHAGSIVDTRDLKLSDITLRLNDMTPIATSDDTGLTGLDQVKYVKSTEPYRDPKDLFHDR